MLKICVLAIPLLLSACARDISPQTYSVGSVGQVNRTISGTIISTRVVDIQDNSGVGGAAGAGIGAVGGSSIGNTRRDAAVGAIAGAVVGGIAGSMADSKLNAQKATEYVVETDNGNLMTIVQGSNPTFAIGQKVLILYGARSRIIEDPRTSK